MKPKEFQAKTISLLIAVVAGALLCSTSPMKAQFSSEVPRWFVWEKISPCQDTRQDWFTVAQTYPGASGSTNAWQLAEGPFFTFAAAMAAADARKMAPTIPNFKSRCCNDWTVFKNSRTGGFEVGRTSPNLGPQPLVQGLTPFSGPLCCEEAFNMAFGSTVGQRDCRALQLSTGVTVILTPGGTFVPAGSGGSIPSSPLPSLLPDTALAGTTLTYYSRSSVEQCQSDCANNANCQGFTWIKAGTYNPRDAAMCYLLSAVTGRNSARGHISAVKGGGGARTGSTGGGGSGGSRAGSGGGVSGRSGGSGGSGGAGGATNPGRLQLVEVKQDPKCATWGNITSCNPNGGQITWGAPVNTNYQWTSPPQQVGAEGFTITMSVSEQNPSDRRSATGIGMSGGGFELDPPNATIPIGAPNQPMSGSLTVKVKPPKNPSGDYYLKIGAYWGPGFTYHYRVVR